VGDETAQLLSLLLAALLGGTVLTAAWVRHRRAWRRRQDADRAWLRENGIATGAPRDPAAWRLLLTDDLGADGTFARDVRDREHDRGRRAVRSWGSSPGPDPAGWPCR